MSESRQFAALSAAEQRKLFERAASAVLPLWHFDNCRLSWISYSANAVFDLKTDAARYVVRLHPPGSVSAPRLRSELLWLRAIRKHTMLLAPLPIATADDQPFATFAPETPKSDPIRAVVFERLAGETKPAQVLTVTDLERVGAYLGKLHRDAQIEMPAEFQRFRLDSAGLRSADSPYHAPNEHDALTREQRRTFDDVIACVDDAMASLDSAEGGFGLIHADLLAKNLLFAGERVVALDFEYCGWGYFLYDLAPLLWQLKGERAADYPPLEAALWSSYLRIRPGAARERQYLETFLAARQLLSCRWLLQNMRHPDLRELAPALLNARAEELRRFLSTGFLQRRSATL